MKFSIRTKVVMALVAGGLIPLLIAVVAIYFLGIDQRASKIGEEFQNMAVHAAEQKSILLSSNIDVFRTLAIFPASRDFLKSASELTEDIPEPEFETQIDLIESTWSSLSDSSPPLDKILTNRLAKIFQKFAHSHPLFKEIFATDYRGVLVASTNKTSDYWQADEDWWQKSYDKGLGKIILKDVDFDESAGVYSVDVCLPVKMDGKVVGIVKGVIDLSAIFHSTLAARLGQKGDVMLIDRSGKIIFDSAGKYSPLKSSLSSQLSHDLKNNSGWFMTKELGGIKKLIGYARVNPSSMFAVRIPPFRWSVIVHQDENLAFASVRRLIFYVFLIGAGLIFLFFLLGVAISERQIIKPLDRLAKAAQDVASGEFEGEVYVRSQDEIGELAKVFNQMLSDLKKRITLDSISLKMLSSLELNEVLNMITEGIVQAFDACFARVWLVGEDDLCDECRYASLCEEKSQCLHLKVSAGMYAKNVEYLRIPIGALKVGKIASERQSSWTNDIASDKELHDVKWHVDEGVVSFAGFPLVHGDKLFGVMAVFGKTPFSENDYEMLEAFGSQTTMAIQNALLIKEINGLNASLEKRVQERTHELEVTNAKLRKADKAKSEFLANMSHELRTPLNAIIGFAEVLRDGLCGELNQEQIGAVADIHESGKHLLQMINDILDLSKVEAGRIEFRPEFFSFTDILRGMQTVVGDTIKKKKLNFTANIPGVFPPVYADMTRFKQIMYNLLSNAVKFTPEGGSITVTASSSADEFLFSIEDTGIGVKEEDMEKLFKEFVQIDSSYSRQYEGTGLGLALTKKLVGMHGGKVWAESEYGKGSIFSFTMPRAASEELKEELAEPERKADELIPSEPGRKTILVAEDNHQAAQLISLYLREAEYNVAVAFDGEEAIEKAISLKPFAITLDIVLPKKDGWQVMQELKSHPETADIPIIIISIVGDYELGFSLGALSYFVKPVGKEQLLKALSKINLERGKILVVDDRQEDIKLISSILQSEGFEVIDASGGEEAIGKVFDEKPDLIILDLMMPVLNGFDVLERLRNSPEVKHIPIIICTAKDLTAEERERLNGKILSIVQKGARAREELVAAVRAIDELQTGLIHT